MKVPCRFCSFREPGCHSTCATYNKFREELDAINEIKQKERALDIYIEGTILKTIDKCRR